MSAGDRAARNPQEGRGRAARNPPESGDRAARNPQEGRGRAARNPPESGDRAARNPPEGGDRASRNPPDAADRASRNPAAAAYLASRRKRVLDLLGACAGLLLASPVLAAAWVAIRFEGPGHPIYRQRRVGRGGVPFELYKLRTMVTGAESMGAGLAVDAGDARITRVGGLLRRTSLDELPNLFNVLRGEMSLVGPRPTVQVQVDRYTERQRGRLEMLPGITGWAQVNGRASLPWADRIELDLWYLEHASLRLDLRIMALSVRMVLTGHGLYRGETGGWREPPPR